MPITAFDSAIFGPLFTDEEVAGLFDDRAQVGAMLAFERALAKAEAQLGVIPSDAGGRIAEVTATVDLDPARLGRNAESTGVPVSGLVAALREATGGEAAQYVHWGATSQDVVDTALILRLRDLLDILEARLTGLTDRLASLTEAHRKTLLAARTRSQQAVPTTFGLKTAGWLSPLIRHRERLAGLRARLLIVQFGGAAGTLAGLGTKGIDVMVALAAELGLGPPVASWHTQRDSLAEIAGWLSLVTGSLGKMGRDLVLLAQSEIGEVHFASAGCSSTMPQKANPVAAEILIALARMNAGLIANMHQAMLHEQERDGAAWSLEWLTLPQMAVATGAALRHSQAIVDSIIVDADRMARNLDASNGLVLAEAATFAIAQHIPRPDAQALVQSACQTVVEEGHHLIDVLRNRTNAPVDWSALRTYANYLGSTDAFIDRVLRSRIGAVEE